MINATKEEFNRLVGKARKIGYSEIDEVYNIRNHKSNGNGSIRSNRSNNSIRSDNSGSSGNSRNYYDDNYKLPPQQERWYNKRFSDLINSKSHPAVFSSRFWKAIGYALLALLLGFLAGTVLNNTPEQQKLKHAKSCRFCHQEPPKLHTDESYELQLPAMAAVASTNLEAEPAAAAAGETVTVTPMTVTYDYELYDGQNLYTSPRVEHIPNLEYDYAVLGLVSARNLNRQTGQDVSLDEVYLHHFSMLPLNMLGAEVLARNASDPYLQLPAGHALHVRVDETPHLKINAHVLSNKNLQPIDGSLARAHKECNECYYAPGKGSQCTPATSGTFLCCGDSRACTVDGDDCACPTTTVTTKKMSKRKATTQYRIELTLLVSKDIDKFRRVDQWNFAAPACSVNLRGDAVFEEYPDDHYCASERVEKKLYKTPSNEAVESPMSHFFFGGGSLFHHIPEDNDKPLVKTMVNVLAPASGTVVWAQSHLHTGGVNATLRKNGEIVCVNRAHHGSDPDASQNAHNEQNHLVRIDSCYDQIEEGGVRFEMGDVFTTESYYYGGSDDARFVGDGASGEHKNVMSMFFLGVILDGSSQYMTQDRTSFNLWNDLVNVAGVKSKSQTEEANNQHLRS